MSPDWVKEQWLLTWLLPGREQGKWYHLLLPLFQMLKWELLRGAIPRLAQGGFLLSQPYLIKRAIILFAMPDSTTNYKKGLLLTVAFALAFVGIGVRETRPFCFPLWLTVEFNTILHDRWLLHEHDTIRIASRASYEVSS